jgi:uncharacterized protein (DUF3084 family)
MARYANRWRLFASCYRSFLAEPNTRRTIMNEQDLFEDFFEEQSNSAEVSTASEARTEVAVELEPTASEPEAVTTNKNFPNARTRTAKPAAEIYSAKWLVRGTEAERIEVQRISETFDMSTSRLFMAKLLNGRTALTTEEAKLFSGILFQLSALGKNVNQLAHAANSARLSNEAVQISQKQLFKLGEEIQNLVNNIKANTKKLWQS